MTSQAIRPTQPDAGPSQPGRHYDSGLVPLPQDIEAFFADQDFTRQFSDADRALLADLVQLRTYTADEIVLLEGQPSDALYFVFRGAVEVLKSDTTLGSQFTITRIERGAMFGEMSFMDREPVSATVRASGPCKVLVIARATLEGADQRDGGHLRIAPGPVAQ
jgi:CRP-like cAMP-binding protein